MSPPTGDAERPPLLRGRTGLRIERHRATMAHLSSAYPFHIDESVGEAGPYLGVNVTGGMGGFYFDPFELYGSNVLTNPNVIVTGDIGSGKSATVKTFLRRSLAVYGKRRFVAVLDPKGEYLPFARRHRLAIVKLRPGGGERLNPMDPRPGDDAGNVITRQSLATALVAGVLGRPLDPTEDALLGWAVANLARTGHPFTLVDVTSAITDPADELIALSRRTPLELAQAATPIVFANDPHRTLADAAGRLTRMGDLPGLLPVLREQVAWMVTDRIDLAARPSPPEFDPSGLKPRQRWEWLQGVLDPVRKLTAVLGVAIGVDLVASPLPRMTVVDDRVVPAGRRHRLPAASLEQLPVGQWVEVGPYTAAEWEARGEHAAGRGAYLRLNKSAYIVAIERGDTATWRLEDVAARTGGGILATGTGTSLGRARADAINTLQGRYPALAPSPVDVTLPVPSGTTRGWEPMPGQGTTSAELRRLDERTTVYVIPGPGGRWMPAVHHAAGDIDRLPLTRSIDDAKTSAVLAGYRAMRLAAMDTPAKFDPMLAAFAASGDYSRRELTALLTSRLDPGDSARIPDAKPAELVELVGAAGASPATTVAILHAESVDAQTVASLLPTAGVPMPEAIRVLHERWDLPRAESAELLGASAAEMRAAGCTPVEIIGVRPRDVLRSLPDDPHLWELAAGTMAAAGHSAATIAGHLVTHSPTPDAFAAALTTGIDDPAAGVAMAIRSGAQGDQLAAATEAYGLSPDEAATLLADHRCPPHVLLDTLDARCDGVTEAVVALAGTAGVDADSIDAWLNPVEPITPPVARWGGLDLGDAAELLATLPDPQAVGVAVGMTDSLDLEPVRDLEPIRP